MSDTMELRFRVGYSKYNAGEIAAFEEHRAKEILRRTITRYDRDDNRVLVPIAVPVVWDPNAEEYVEVEAPTESTTVRKLNEDTGLHDDTGLVKVEGLAEDPDGVIQDAIISMIGDDAAEWTAEGLPSVATLSERLGFKVTSGQRDAIWAAMQG